MNARAFAKINWDLHILGRRADGFHELDTLMVTIGLADELSFTEAPELSMSCSNPALPVGEENLVIRAARALAQAAGRPAGVRIHLEKRIPHGGGLGGGSSDAATVLVSLNRLWDLNWSRERLAQIGATLGSDVPFFLWGGWCRCRGRGEIIEPLPELAAHGAIRILLLLPDLVVPTPAVYRALKAQTWKGEPFHRCLTELSETLTYLRASVPLPSTPQAAEGAAFAENGLRAAAVTVEPGLALLQNLLAARFPGQWQMSGSGATHFLVLSQAQALDAKALEEDLQRRLPFPISVLDTTTLAPRSAPSES